VIQVPVAVDDGHDRLAARPRGGENPFLLRRVTAGIDDDQAFRRIEDYAVSVGLTALLEGARDEQIRSGGCAAAGEEHQNGGHAFRHAPRLTKSRLPQRRILPTPTERR